MGRVKKELKNVESSTFVEMGGYVHQDAGKARAKLYVSGVNEPLQVDDAAITKRLKKIRVTMNVTEDKTPKDNSVYEKKVWMEQQHEDKSPSEPSSEEMPVDGLTTEAFDEPENGGLTPTKILKNFVDNIAEDVRLWKVIALCAGAVGLAAFVIAVLK